MPGLIDRLSAFAHDRALTAADTWERHLIVAQLVGRPRQLVDVGGLPGQLASFLPDTKVVAVNVTEPADMLVNPERLPFDDDAFDVSTSLDVLEHVPPAQRAGFIAEQCRVAAQRAVLCCPLDSPEHRAAEEEVQAWYRSITGEEHPWLIEHLDNGLPALHELQSAFAAVPGRVRFAFHGDFRVTNAQFRSIVLARHRHHPGDVIGFARRRLTHRPDVTLADEPSPYTNRVFVISEQDH